MRTNATPAMSTSTAKEPSDWCLLVSRLERHPLG